MSAPPITLFVSANVCVYNHVYAEMKQDLILKLDVHLISYYRHI